MRIERRAEFHGPSLHAAFPAIWLRLRRDPGDPRQGLDAAGLARALDECPELGEDREFRAAWLSHGPARPGEPPSLGAAMAGLALALQRWAGADAARFSISEDPDADTFDVAFAFEQADIGMLAGLLAAAIVNHACRIGRDGEAEALAEVAARRSGFVELAEKRRLNPPAAALVRALTARDIPLRRLGTRLLVLGQGRFQQHLDFTITGNTSLLGNRIAGDKRLSNRLLRELGLPATEQATATSRRGAVRAAERMGYPVVLKPKGGSQGRLVFVGLADAKAVEKAYEDIVAAGHDVLVERLVEGFDHRLLVVAGELVAATKRVPGHVIGDGLHSVEALIHKANRDPRRGPGHSNVMSFLALDEEADRMMRKAGLRRDSVPPSGRMVYLRGMANLSRGGSSVDMTDAIHPENRDMALRAAAACRVDILGIDFITPDITRSYREVGGAICEVNTRPGIRSHETPAEGRPRDVITPIVDSLYPPGRPGRIPSAAILGGDDATAFALGHILKLAGHRVGLSVRGEVWIDGPHAVAQDAPAPRAAAMVLGDALVDAAVLAFAPEDLATHGLGFDGAAVGAVLGPAGAAGLGRVILDGARHAMVLAGGDAAAMALAGAVGQRRLVISTTAAAPAHPLANAAITVTAFAPHIEIAEGAAPPIRLAAPPGAADAVAIALALGVAIAPIRLALASLTGGFDRRLGSFRALRPVASRLVILDRLRGNPLLADVCRLAATAAAGHPGLAVIDAAAADRIDAAALLPAGFRHVMVDGMTRATIAEAVAGPAAAPAVVLILADNVERACRYVGDAAGSIAAD